MADEPKSLATLLAEAFAAERTEHVILGRKVYTTPVSFAEQTQINAKHPDSATDRMIETVVLKCVDENGEPVFGVDDKPLLKRKVKVSVLNRLMLAIVGDDVETAQKK